MVTSKDVALKAGVSHATVSRVFRNENVVSEKTREKILMVAQELGYVPSLFASSLKKEKSKAISYLIENGENPFHLNLACKVDKLLFQKGYRLSLFFDDDPNDNTLQTLYSAISTGVQGVIFIPDNRYARQKDNLDLLCKTRDLNFLQLFGTNLHGYKSILYDDATATYNATKFLLDKGHKNILYVGNEERSEGVYKAFEKYGFRLEIEPAFVDMHGDGEYFYHRIYESVSTQKPTAIFSLTDQIGGATLRVLKDLGLKFPDDISLLIYDDTSWAKWMGITVVAHPLDETAELISETIISLCEHNNLPHTTNFLMPYLIDRGSVIKI